IRVPGLFQFADANRSELVITICTSHIVTAGVMLRPLLVCNDGTGAGTCQAAYDCALPAAEQTANNRAAQRSAAYVERLTMPPVNTGAPYGHKSAPTVPVISSMSHDLCRCSRCPRFSHERDADCNQ